MLVFPAAHVNWNLNFYRLFSKQNKLTCKIVLFKTAEDGYNFCEW